MMTEEDTNANETPQTPAAPARTKVTHPVTGDDLEVDAPTEAELKARAEYERVRAEAKAKMPKRPAPTSAESKAYDTRAHIASVRASVREERAKKVAAREAARAAKVETETDVTTPPQKARKGFRGMMQTPKKPSNVKVPTFKNRHR